MYSSISRNVLLQKSEEQHNLIMRNCSLFLNGSLLLITNPVSKKKFLITCTSLIKSISRNVTKFKKILTLPWTNILLFHGSLYILRKLISWSFYNRALPKSNLKSGSAPEKYRQIFDTIHLQYQFVPLILCFKPNIQIFSL